jgi:hypothetical protein
MGTGINRQHSRHRPPWRRRGCACAIWREGGFVVGGAARAKLDDRHERSQRGALTLVGDISVRDALAIAADMGDRRLVERTPTEFAFE